MMAEIFEHYRVKQDNQKAVEVTDTNKDAIAKWCGGEVMDQMNIEKGPKPGILYIPTLSGTLTAETGDIVAQDDSGRFNVFDKERFFARYERAGRIYPFGGN